jgi:hypothetical protein
MNYMEDGMINENVGKELIDFINRRMEKYNFYGGEDNGYWKGRLAAFEDILDQIEIIKEKEGV